MMELRTLGTLDLRQYDGQPVRSVLAQPRRLALLTYLAVALPRRFHRRDSLLGLFWPEQEEARARNSLSQALHFLRRSVGEEVILTRGEGEIGLDERRLWCDAVAFEQTLAEERREEALALYGGGFLEGFYISEAPEWERWLDGVRSRLHEKAMRAAWTLAEAREAEGDLARAIELWRWLAARDPASSRLTLRVMQTLAAAGDRVGALQQAQRHAAFLRDEYGAEPERAVTTLIERLRRAPAAAPDDRPTDGAFLPPGEEAVQEVERPPLAAPREAAHPTTVESQPHPPRHNLPARPPLIGRRAETAAVRERLRQEEVRLLTLTGTGGIGKTRLAIQVASELVEEYPHAAYFIDLATLTDPGQVVPAIGRTLGLRDLGERPLCDALRSYLHERRMLLLLDNFEHVLEAAPQVAELLSAAPGLKVLATSRTSLRLSFEHEYPVPPLAVPDPDHRLAVEDLRSYGASHLFLARAQAVRPDFRPEEFEAAVIAEICARLDGLPLAIELAAARSKVLPPRALLARLESRLDLLSGGARDLPARHQTLRAAIAWSHTLLYEQERTLFRRLAVFVGGCTLEAAEAVCSGEAELRLEVFEGIASLVDKSLLYRQESQTGEPRYFMLETIHEYARERLHESGEAEAVRREHARWFLTLAERAEPHLKGGNQAPWLRRLRAEHDNLRAALEWSLGEPREGAEDTGDSEIGLRLSGALWRFWWTGGHLREGRRWLQLALERSGATSAAGESGKVERDPLAGPRAKALRGAGILAWDQGEYADARAFLDESLALGRALSDRAAIANSLNNLGLVAQRQGDLAAARALHEESLAIRRELGEKRGIATSLNNLAVVREHQGDSSAARTLLEESMAIDRELDDRRGLATSLHNVGMIAHEQDDPDAWRYLVESLAIYRELEDRIGIIECLEGLAAIHTGEDRAYRAAVLLAAAETLRDSLGAPLPPLRRPRRERHAAAARAQLDEQAWEAARTEGRHLTLEQAIARAVEER